MEQTIVFDFDCPAEEMPVEKSARIFEAGEYPDKGITITEADLDAIVENFAGCPVKVEHTDSPLDPLGAVKQVWRKGRELFATLAFPQDLMSFLERRGIKRLSVGLLKDPLRLAEVSLVLSPRVATAALFRNAETRGHGDAESRPIPHSALTIPHSGGEVNQSMSTDEKDREIADLKFALRAKDVDTRLAALKSQGKVVPASESLAREILLQGDQIVKFSDGEATVGDLFLQFLEAQPKVIEFSEMTPGKAGTEARPLLSAEEEELLSKLGISREQVEKYA